MKKVVFDINEMSDSKEVYGQRPNPFYAVFIYCMVALLLVGFLYSCFGKIEIVATANGVIRPNEDVSTISSLLGGRVTEVNYYDGQIVHPGDVLFTVDTSESRIQLEGLMKLRADCQLQADMINKFLNAVNSGINPFSSDPGGQEYPYYTQYESFLLNLENSELSFEYEADKTDANIRSLNQQISQIQKKIAGLNAYKKSVEQGTNLASEYPQYESMYLLYVSDLEALENEYLSQKAKIESDSSAESNQKSLEYYQKQYTEYGYLLESIQTGKSVFSIDDTSDCKRMYDDYTYNLSTYEKQYEAALTSYNEKLGNRTEKYDETTLKGYRLYRKSIVSGKDEFLELQDSAIYRDLYINYRTTFDLLDGALVSATKAYEDLIANPDTTAEDVAAALQIKNTAETERNAFRDSTLEDVDEVILEIQEIIALRGQTESAREAMTAYQNKMTLQYSQAYAELGTKMEALRLSIASAQNREDLLNELETSYKGTKEQHYYQTIIQIDGSLQTLQNELIAARSSLNQNQVAKEWYESNKGDNGELLPISTVEIEQTTALLNQLDSIHAQLDDLDIQVRQIEEQIAQGTVTAKCNGIVSLVQTVVEGDVITAGTVVATVIPVRESKYKVQLYVNNADIGNIEVGDAVKFNILALPSNQYGTVNGTISSISTDTLIQDGQYSGYYLVECTVGQDSVTGSEGHAAALSTGMQVEAKIVVKEKTIIRYLLEKIDVF